MEHSEQLGELAAALAKAQGQMVGAVKDADNPFFKAKYADLASIWDACRVPLSTHGLSVVQTTELGADVTVTTTLLHASGQWLRGHLQMTPTKHDPQGVGSCLTYARRYALAAMVGICSVDDDGEAAAGRGEKSPPTAPPRRPGPARPPTGAAAAATPSPAPKASKPGRISEPQAKRLYAKAKAAGHTVDALKAWLATHYGLEHMLDIPRSDYEAIVARVENSADLANDPHPGQPHNADDLIPWEEPAEPGSLG